MGMDILGTHSAPMVDKEIAVYLLAYNLVCALMVRAAAGSGGEPRSLSFKGTVQLYLAFEQQLRFAVGASVRTMTAHLPGRDQFVATPASTWTRRTPRHQTTAEKSPLADRASLGGPRKHTPITEKNGLR